MLIEIFSIALAFLFFVLPFWILPHGILRFFSFAVIVSVISATVTFLLLVYQQVRYYIWYLFSFPLIPIAGLLWIVIIALGSAYIGRIIRKWNLTIYQPNPRLATSTLIILLLAFTIISFIISYGLLQYTEYHENQRIEAYWQKMPTCSATIKASCVIRSTSH